MKKELTVGFSQEAGLEDKLVIHPYRQEDMADHDHNFFELVYVTEGTTVHTLNDVDSMLSAGDYFIVDYGSVHRYAKSRGLTLINCLFLPEIIDDALKGCCSLEELIHSCLLRYYKLYMGQTSANRIFHDTDGRVLGLLQGIMEEYHKKDMGYQEIFRCKLLEIMILTVRNLADNSRAAKNTAVLEAIAYINSNLSSSCILSAFCEKYHYTPQYISRRFRQETGYTVMEYLHKVRMEKSCELLAGSDLPVAEVAQEAGYTDLKYFNLLFKRMIKMTPREYRKHSF